MTQSAIIENTISVLSKLPTEKATEVADFADFMLKKYHEEMLLTKSSKKKFDLAEMVSRMPADYVPCEEDFGKPRGKEVW